MSAPVPDGKQLTSADCPDCGLPVLIGKYYGTGRGDVSLDAMPVQGWECLAPIYGEYVMPYRGKPFYTEHICPLDMLDTTSTPEGSA